MNQSIFLNSQLKSKKVVKINRNITDSQVRIQHKTPPLIVTATRKQLKDGASDYAIYRYIENLRSEVEQIKTYRKIKAKAKTEIKTLPDNVMDQLFRKTLPFINALPAAHSKGHVVRDLINLTVILHDPETASYDDVEILVGILAGVFHDIGNSVIDRDEEHKRLTLHAEVGAWVFGKLAANIVPPNIFKLTQFAMTAHTNFVTSREKTINGATVKLQPYDTNIINGNKVSITLARTTDRSDLINGAVYPVRTIIRFSKYINQIIHVTGEKHIEFDSEMEDFRYRFSCSKTKKGTFLYEFQSLANNNDSINVFNKYDTLYINNEIFTPNTKDLQHFIDTIVDYQTNVHKPENTKQILKRFLQLCELLEPGEDISERLGMFRRKFSLLPDDQQWCWIMGFKLIVDDLYPQFYARTKEKITSVPTIAFKRGGILQIIINDIYTRANQVLRALNPSFIDQNPNRSSSAIGRIMTNPS
jgi:hypothetical protein